MSLSNESEKTIAHYLSVARQLREAAEKPEYAHLKERLLEVATEWAHIAETAAKEAGLKDTTARSHPHNPASPRETLAPQ